MAYNQARTSCGFWGESFHNCSDPVVQYDRSLFWCWWGGRKRVSFPLLPFFIGALVAGSVSAQEDTTPPVLLDFKISPTLIDTAGGDVRIDFCVTADDDFSGLDTVS